MVLVRPAARPGGRGRGGGTLVGAVPVTQRPFTDRVEVLGVAKGQQSVTLTSNQAEMVTGVHFKPGQKVTKGQVLLDLKADEEDAQIMQAQATVNQAKAGRAIAGRPWPIAGVAPRASAEQYTAAYGRPLRPTSSAAQARRSDRVIRAPFAGTVGLSDIAPGALISPGTAIATLDDTSVIHVDFDVPDRFLPIIREGMPIQARPDAYPDLIQGGVIARIDTRIDERTRAVKARAEFKNGDGKLKPGMLMRVGIERGNRMSLSVPESAIQFSADNSFVYVVNPSAAQPGQGGQGQGGQAPGQGGQRQGGQPQGQPAAAAPSAPGAQRGPGQLAQGPQGGPGGGSGRGPGGGPAGAGAPRVAAPPCSAILNAADSRIGPAGRRRLVGLARLDAPAKAVATMRRRPLRPARRAAGRPGGGRGGNGRPGQAEQRPVLAGLIENGYVEIKDGLRPGEIVVADGLNKLQPGQPVNYCAAVLPVVGGPTGGSGRQGARGGGRPGRSPRRSCGRDAGGAGSPDARPSANAPWRFRASGWTIGRRKPPGPSGRIGRPRGWSV